MKNTAIAAAILPLVLVANGAVAAPCNPYTGCVPEEPPIVAPTGPLPTLADFARSYVNHPKQPGLLFEPLAIHIPPAVEPPAGVTLQLDDEGWIVLTDEPEPVPEPSLLALLAGGLFLAALKARKG
jgi:hypothetical protein